MAGKYSPRGPRLAPPHRTHIECSRQPEEEVAPAYVFFASNADSSYITGEVLTLLGVETSAG
jgi:NAD(P)-dependent dehydrogenase (short-subunit alcohol dehydrogenase family)